MLGIINNIVLNKSTIKALLPYIPQLQRSVYVRQRTGTVFQHTQRVVDLLQVRNIITVCCAVFHDLGKCRSFKSHQLISSDIARAFFTHHGFDYQTVSSIDRIVRSHMYDLWPVMLSPDKMTDKLIASVGLSNITNWFALRRADLASYGNPTSMKLVDDVQQLIKCKLEQQGGDLELLSPHSITMSGKGEMWSSVQCWI